MANNIDRAIGRIEGAVVAIKEDVKDIKGTVGSLSKKLDENTVHTLNNSRDIKWMNKKSLITGGAAGTGAAGVLAIIIAIAKKWLGSG